MKTPKKLWVDYKKPTPARWRKRGDFALVLLGVLQISIASAPADALTVRQSYWLSLGLTLVITSYKFWTNTHTDENTNI